MKIPDSLLNLGLSQYEMTAYLALVGRYPVNGSQLSRSSGIPRARIYDVLRSLRDKGLAAESADGLYVPLPPDEFTRRLKRRFNADMALLEDRLKAASQPPAHDFVWTVRGHEAVMAKAREMVSSSAREICIRVFPREGQELAGALLEAESRGVAVRYVSMGRPPVEFEVQVEHPESDRVERHLGGRSFDLIVDREEILVGLFETGREDLSPINWARNHWFVVSGRDSIRHDFFHYFLYKTYEKKQKLTARERRIYELTLRDQ